MRRPSSNRCRCVPANEAAQRALGRDLRSAQNFDVIRNVIANEPGVHFAQFHTGVPPDGFHDEIEHLNPRGMTIVAEQLVGEILAIKRAIERR